MGWGCAAAPVLQVWSPSGHSKPLGSFGMHSLDTLSQNWSEAQSVSTLLHRPRGDTVIKGGRGVSRLGSSDRCRVNLAVRGTRAGSADEGAPLRTVAEAADDAVAGPALAPVPGSFGDCEPRAALALGVRSI